MYRPTEECHWRNVWEKRVWQSVYHLCAPSHPLLSLTACTFQLKSQGRKSKALQLENDENLLVLLHIIVKLQLWIDFALYNLLLCCFAGKI